MACLNVQIFIVLNKVSSVSVDKIDIKKSIKVVFYHTGRCDRNEIQNTKIKIPYNKYTDAIIGFLFKIKFLRVYLNVPHTSMGKQVNKLISEGHPISLIPDGMDFYREIPKNINLKQNNLNIRRLYVDKMHEYLPQWMCKYKSIKNLNINWIKNGDLNKPILEEDALVVVESEGTEKLFDGTLNIIPNFTKIKYITHPAIGKKIKITITGDVEYLELTKRNLENELAKLKKVKVYIGESFTTVMLINSEFYDSNEVKILLSREKKDLLNPLISILNKTNAEIIYY